MGRTSSTLFLAFASALSLALTVGVDLSPIRLVSLLTRHGSAAHGFIAGWLLTSPLLLLAALTVRRRTPWPWVVTVGLTLLAVTVVVARFPHVVAMWAWLLLACALLAGLASVVTAFPAEPLRPGSEHADRRAGESK